MASLSAAGPSHPSSSSQVTTTGSPIPEPGRNVSMDPPQTLKLLLIGSSSVGKSSLLLRFTDEVFLGPDESSATIGVDFRVKMIQKRGKRYKLSIWDTAGQERFRTLTSSYYRGAQGVILVYDVTNRETFDSLPSWFTELDTFSSTSQVVKLIVGNKVDKDFQRTVTTEEGRRLAEERGATFFETSAKTMRGVEEVFDTVVEKIIDTPSLYMKVAAPAARAQQVPGGISLDEQEQSGGWCAC